MRAAWSGSYVTVRFFGTSLAARIQDDGVNYFNVVVDGGPPTVLKTDKANGQARYPLVDGLAPGEHTLSLHRRTEARAGEITLHGFETDPAGRLLPPPGKKTRLIEFVGDSITTGYGNEGKGPRCTYVAREQNELATYGALAARALAADHTTIAWSGKTIHEMTEYFDKALPARTESPAWNFAAYTPDVIVLNLGTNNVANQDPGEARFVRVYLELLRMVRKAHPHAFLIAALGPMLTDRYPEGRQSLTKARRYTMRALSKAKEAGESRLAFLEFREQRHEEGLGCGFHPGLATHKRMGEQLAAFIKEQMGW